MCVWKLDLPLSASKFEILQLDCEAGIKSALSKSAAYPYDFGVSVAALVQTRGHRAPATEIDFGEYQGEDTLGALDDFIKSRKNVWWRNL